MSIYNLLKSTDKNYRIEPVGIDLSQRVSSGWLTPRPIEPFLREYEINGTLGYKQNEYATELTIDSNHVNSKIAPGIRVGEEGLADLYRGSRFIPIEDHRFASLHTSPELPTDLNRFKEISLVPWKVYTSLPQVIRVNQTTGEFSEWFTVTFLGRLQGLSLETRHYRNGVIFGQYEIPYGWYTDRGYQLYETRPNEINLHIAAAKGYFYGNDYTKFLLRLTGTVSERVRGGIQSITGAGYSGTNATGQVYLGYKLKMRYLITNTFLYRQFDLPLFLVVSPEIPQSRTVNGYGYRTTTPPTLTYKTDNNLPITYNPSLSNETNSFQIVFDDPDIPNTQYSFPEEYPEGYTVEKIWLSEIRDKTSGGSRFFTEETGLEYVQWGFDPNRATGIRFRNVPTIQYSQSRIKQMRARLTLRLGIPRPTIYDENVYDYHDVTVDIDYVHHQQ